MRVKCFFYYHLNGGHEAAPSQNQVFFVNVSNLKMAIYNYENYSLGFIQFCSLTPYAGTLKKRCPGKLKKYLLSL